MLKKQPNSRHCFLCGLDNPVGLRLAFYEDEDGRVVAHYTAPEEYQGYPGVLHGGIACALLDEVMVRTVVSRDIWAVTAEMKVRFHLPIPLGEPLTAVGRIVRLRSRTLEAQGEIHLADGSVAATAEGKYVRLPNAQVEEFRDELGFW